jgi:hypothetical protein
MKEQNDSKKERWQRALNRPLFGAQPQTLSVVIPKWLKRYLIVFVIINFVLFIPFVAFFGFAPIEKTGICVPGWRGYSLSYEILFVCVMLIGLGLVPLFVFLLRKAELNIVKIFSAGILLFLAGVYVPTAFGLFIPPDKISECNQSRSTHAPEPVSPKP